MNKLTPEIIGWAQAGEAQFGVPAAMNIAAAIEESGLGAHIPPGSNNFHGLKGSGPATSTKEQTAAGVWYTIKSGFHMFKSPADSFMYYAWLISHGAPYAAAWRAWEASPKTNADVETLTRGVAARYATALSYAKALVSIEVADQLFPYDKTEA
jgi:flagellum-specific peptidoglycan hydrolase FlgJ